MTNTQNKIIAVFLVLCMAFYAMPADVISETLSTAEIVEDDTQEDGMAAAPGNLSNDDSTAEFIDSSTAEPASELTEEPVDGPTASLTPEPTVPASELTEEPVDGPTASLTPEPTVPAAELTEEPVAGSAVTPSAEPDAELTEEPSDGPAASAVVEITAEPTIEPTDEFLFTSGYAFVVSSGVPVYKNASTGSDILAYLSNHDAVYVSDRNIIDGANSINDMLLCHFDTEQGVVSGYVRARNLSPCSAGETDSLVAAIRSSGRGAAYDGHPLQVLFPVNPVTAEIPEKKTEDDDLIPEVTQEPEATLAFTDLDAAAPTLNSYSFSSSSVTAPATVSISADIVDEGSGVAACYCFFNDHMVTLSYSAISNQWAGELTLDEYAEAGIYEIRFELYDNQGNTQNIIVSDTLEVISSITPYDELIDFTYTIADNEITITGYTGEGGTVTVPELIEEYPVTRLGEGAFIYNSTITGIILPGSLTSIERNAFQYCTNLLSITIPNSVTTIVDGSFYGCSSLQSITLPSGITSIGDGTFGKCSGLTEITIPGGVTSIDDWAFTECSGLTSVVIPESVTRIETYAFSYCSNLTGITIPGSVTGIGNNAFQDCSNLTIYGYTGSYAQTYAIANNIPFIELNAAASVFTYTIAGNEVTITGYTGEGGAVTIPELIEGYPVTSIYFQAFRSCGSITSVSIPSQVKSIHSYAFMDCTALAEVDIPSGVASIGISAFQGCSSLVGFTIPEGLTRIDNYVFRYCSSLDGITIPSNITSIGMAAFYGCSSLTAINIPEGITVIEDSVFMLCRSLSEIEIPSSVTRIKNFAFDTCDSLMSIDIPASVTSIGLGAFQNCNSLTGISLPPDLKSIAGATFAYCNSLADIVIPSGVTSIGTYAFYDCLNLANITLPSGITEIQAGSFGRCAGLTSIIIPNGVTSIGYWAFIDCGGLTEIIIPDGVTHIGADAFSRCGSLLSITIPRGVTSIDENAFLDCPNLTIYGYTGSYAHTYAVDNGIPFVDLTGNIVDFTYTIADNEVTITGYIGSAAEIVIPVLIEGYPVVAIGDWAFVGGTITGVTVNYGLKRIGYGAFNECRNLTEVILPGTVLSIGGEAFGNCVSLAEITLPEGLIYLEGAVFLNCTSLLNITIPSSLTSVGDGAFSLCASLTGIFVDANNAAYISLDGILYDRPFKTIVAYPNGKADSSFTIPFGIERIGNNAFEGHEKLGTLIIPPGVQTIGSNAFAHCTRLTEIVIPDSVTTIGYGAFFDCSMMENILIPAGVTSIGSSAFECCLILEYIGVNPNNPAYMSQEGILYNKNKTTLVAYPSGKTDGSFSIPASVISIDQSAFMGNHYLTGITIHAGVTSIGLFAFSNCTSLISITVPGSIAHIEDSTFEYCPSLTNVVLTEGVTSIGGFAFAVCENLQAIVIPPSVASISEYAFEGCTNLTIHGRAGSYAEVYAEELNIPFVADGINPTPVSVRILRGGEDVTGGKVMLDFAAGANTVKLAAAVQPVGAAQSVTWKTSSTAIATVDESGMVTGIKAGTVTITARSTDNTAIYATCKVTVATLAREISITGAATMTSGKSTVLTAAILPEDVTTKTVTWASSDTGVAIVSKTGKVTAQPVAEVKTVAITASTNDGTNLTASHMLTVYPAVAEVRILRSGEDVTGRTTVLDLATGENSLALTAAVQPEGAVPSVTWKSSSAAVATVDESGMVTGIKAGTVTITARSTDSTAIYATCKVTVATLAP